MTQVHNNTPFSIKVKTPNGHMMLNFEKKEEPLNEFTGKVRTLEKYLSMCKTMDDVTFGLEVKNVDILERLMAVQCIVSTPCDKETAKCAYDELDSIMGILTS